MQQESTRRRTNNWLGKIERRWQWWQMLPKLILLASLVIFGLVVWVSAANTYSPATAPPPLTAPTAIPVAQETWHGLAVNPAWEAWRDDGSEAAYMTTDSTNRVLSWLDTQYHGQGTKLAVTTASNSYRYVVSVSGTYYEYKIIDFGSSRNIVISKSFK